MTQLKAATAEFRQPTATARQVGRTLQGWRRLWRATVAGITGLLLATALLGSARADEPAPYAITLSYDFHESSGLPGISNMMVFNTYQSGGGATWPFSLPDGYGLLTDPFAKSSDNPPLTGLWLGVWTDDSKQAHLLMGLSDTNTPSGTIESAFAPSSASEAALVSSLTYITSTNRDDDETTWDSNAQTVDSFVSALQGLGYAFALPAPVPGTTQSSPFRLFSTTAESNEISQLGTGTAHVAAVPEPSAMLMLAAGLLLVLPVARRRERAAACPLL